MAVADFHGSRGWEYVMSAKHWGSVLSTQELTGAAWLTGVFGRFGVGKAE